MIRGSRCLPENNSTDEPYDPHGLYPEHAPPKSGDTLLIFLLRTGLLAFRLPIQQGFQFPEKGAPELPVVFVDKPKGFCIGSSSIRQDSQTSSNHFHEDRAG